ncbi:MAG TPA: phosphoribosyltransferase [Chitinophagaceae bacterium]|jgi:predicted amidophosphoribosyltransferase
MLDQLVFANLLQYSPRGVSDISKKSRNITDSIKGGRISNFAPKINEIILEHKELLRDFLNEEVTLIPMPRSSPIRESDLWPAHEISKMLASFNFGTVSTCLIRSNAIRKSSLFFKADERPSIDEQYNSMQVKNFVPSANITLVDDVLTLGRTSIAAASRLADKFPNASIKLLVLVRTMGFVPEIDIIKKVEIGTISYNHGSGKCSRNP